MKKLFKIISLLMVLVSVFAVNSASAATLRSGSRGTEVKRLQMNLNGLAYAKLTTDGIYGGQTVTAVKKFQTANGLTVDGIAGTNTITKIKAIVTELQNNLKSMGYSIGTIDGVYGNNTKNAVKKFQRANGLSADGIAGSKTLSKIQTIKNSSNSNTSSTSAVVSGFSKTNSSVKTYSVKNNGNQNISNSFKIKEFRCNDGSDIVKIDLKLVALLQDIRNHFGKPVVINSAYRTNTYNKKVGGASNSYHLYGKAADIRINGVAPSEIAKYAQSLGVKGIGLYSGFVHVDTRTSKYYWKNNGKSNIGVNSF